MTRAVANDGYLDTAEDGLMPHISRPSAASTKSNPAATSWRNDWSFWFRLSMIAAFLLCAGSIQGQPAETQETIELPAPPPFEVPPLTDSESDNAAESEETPDDESPAAKKPEADKAEKADGTEADETPAVPVLPPMVTPHKLTVPSSAAPADVTPPPAAQPTLPPTVQEKTTEKKSERRAEKAAPADKPVVAEDKARLGSDLKPGKKPQVEPGRLMPLPVQSKPSTIGGDADPKAADAQPSKPKLAEPKPAEPATVENDSSSKPESPTTPAPSAETEMTTNADTEEEAPLPIVKPEPKQTPPEQPAPSEAVAKDEPAPEPVSEPTAEVATQSPAEEDESSWSILITPGQQHAKPQDKESRIVTFKLDSNGKMIAAPEEKTLGPQETYVAPQGVSPAGHHEAARFPSQSPDASNYQEIYDSIPYSRAEYLANPGYRHDAAMEILFGEMRPTVINKQDTPRRIYNLPQIHEDPRVQRQPVPYPWRYPAYGPNRYLGYGYGPGYGFGYGPYWTPNSTYRRSATVYGPLFYRYYRPLRPY